MGLQASGSSDGSTVAEGVPQPGDVVGGKFVVERVLGVGGMGVVVAARHAHLDQTVAIKFLRRDAAKDGAAVNRFLREARAVAALQSDHVIRVMDAGTLDDGLPYMVMEHLGGTDLGQVLEQRGSLPLDETVEYLLQAMEGIAEAHAAGIVHRDLKPSNLFISVRPDGAPFVKVLDFGISKALDAGGLPLASLTATSMTLGSPLYMSPEQVRSSKNVDQRTDIWALGVIAYELLAGLQPFEAETVTGLCAKIVADEPVPLRSKRPDVPASFDAVVMHCLEKLPARRYQSVAELAAGLTPFASLEGRRRIERIARIVGASRASLAGSPNAARTMSSAPEQAQFAAGFAETVASWQTAGGRRRKRVVTATASVLLAAAALACAVLVATLPRGATVRASASAAATLPAANDIAARASPPVVHLAPADPRETVLPEIAPGATAAASTEPAPEPSTYASVAAASASSVPPATTAPRRSWVAPTPTNVGAGPKPPMGSAPPPARTPDDLMLDRK